MWRRIGQTGLLTLAVAMISGMGVGTSPLAAQGRLTVPHQQVEHVTTRATGVQVYVCKAKLNDPTAFEWTFKAPIADLWDEQGEKVGTHYAGPTWESQDGSTVVAEVEERIDAPVRGAIPWLLLRAKANTGDGTFTPVTYVQRVETAGGVAPTDGCDETVVNVEREVQYTATYVFYVWGGDEM